MAEPKTRAKTQRMYLVGGMAAGLVLWLWWRRRAAARASAGAGIGDVASATLPGAMPSGAMGATTDFGDLLGQGPAQSITEWQERVQRWGNSLGFDAAVTQNAIQSYGTGQCLSPEGFRIIDQALSYFGQPPSAPYQGLVLCQPIPHEPDVPAPPAPQAPGIKYPRWTQDSNGAWWFEMAAGLSYGPFHAPDAGSSYGWTALMGNTSNIGGSGYPRWVQDSNGAWWLESAPGTSLGPFKYPNGKDTYAWTSLQGAPSSQYAPKAA